MDVKLHQVETSACAIKAVGRRRDGGTRYWCTAHRADATAKYGRRAKRCRYAHIPAVMPNEILELDLDAHSGGVGVWGAVPPIYDTTRLGIDRGVHVHARKRADSNHKDIDDTFRRVRVRKGGVALDVDELDAIYFMVSIVFKKTPEEVICTHCNVAHLDKDWFSVHPHKSHLCAACGRSFRDTKIAVGNPAARVEKLEGTRASPTRATKPLSLKQQDYPGGIRIWGSNDAILWTAKKPELTGIHVHAYSRDGDKPEIDETFASLSIDGVKLDPNAARIYMAQLALPHLNDRVISATCEKCARPAFHSGDDAFEAASNRPCTKCGGALLQKTRFRNVIANPTVAALHRLAESAPRAPQKHDLGLLPETL